MTQSDDSDFEEFEETEEEEKTQPEPVQTYRSRSLRPRSNISYVEKRGSATNQPESWDQGSKIRTRAQMSVKRGEEKFNNLRIKDDFLSYQELLDRLQKILRLIRDHEAAWPFLEPVSENVPMYYEIIQNPIDISAIERKLDVCDYSSEIIFFEDLELMFENCKTFNQPKSEIFKAGKVLKRYVEKLKVEYFPDFEDFDDYASHFIEIEPIQKPQAQPKEHVSTLPAEESSDEDQDNDSTHHELIFPSFSDEEEKRVLKGLQKKQSIIEITFFFWLLSSTEQNRNTYILENLSFEKFEKCFLNFSTCPLYRLLHWYIFCKPRFLRQLKHLGADILTKVDFDLQKLFRKMGFNSLEEQQAYVDSEPSEKADFLLDWIYRQAVDGSVLEESIRLISEEDLRQSSNVYTDEKTFEEYFCFSSFGLENSKRVYKSKKTPLVNLAYDLDYLGILTKLSDYKELVDKVNKDALEPLNKTELKSLLGRIRKLNQSIEAETNTIEEVKERMQVNLDRIKHPEKYYFQTEFGDPNPIVVKLMEENVLGLIDISSKKDLKQMQSTFSDVEISSDEEEKEEQEEEEDHEEEEPKEEKLPEIVFDGEDYLEIRRSSRKRKTIQRFSTVKYSPKKKKKSSLLKKSSSRPKGFSLPSHKRKKALLKKHTKSIPRKKRRKSNGKSKPPKSPKLSVRTKLINDILAAFKILKSFQFEENYSSEIKMMLNDFYLGSTSTNSPTWTLVAQGKDEIRDLAYSLREDEPIESLVDVVKKLEEEELKIQRQEKRQQRLRDLQMGVNTYRSSRLALEEEKKKKQREEEDRKNLARQLWERRKIEQRSVWNKERIIRVRQQRMLKREQAKLLSKDEDPGRYSSGESEDPATGCLENGVVYKLPGMKIQKAVIV
eukprot:augustus_masked-scaffold_16-processed-gene-6.12-mRNA-1 protein AED:0.44 eAED:0.45 QI:0/0/0/0.5/1/1/2/0/889